MSGTTGVPEALDLAAIIKASQTIFSEIQLDKLLANLVQVVIENTGAEKFALILLKGNSLVIEAITGADKRITVLQSIPVEHSHEIPISLINSVKSTLTTLAIDNAVAGSDFATDPYILQQKPKSLLCSPIINQGKLTGILYLENNLTVGAFTSDRLEFLKLLTAQVAVSLENAQLYAALSARTTDLQQIVAELQKEIGIRKQAETSLAASEARFRTIAATMPGCIFQFCNRNGVWSIDYMSEGIYSISGVTAEEMMQNINTFISCLHRDDVNDYIASVTEALTNLAPWHYEGRLIKFNKEIKWWQGDSIPTKNEKGEIIFCGTLVDITARKVAEEERKQAKAQLENRVAERTTELQQLILKLEREIEDRKRVEMALAESETRFRTIAATMPGSIFQFSATHGVWKIDYVSERLQEVSGVTAAEVMQDFNNFIIRQHPEDMERYLASIIDCVQNLTAWHYEGRLVKPSGEIRWWQGDSMPTFNEKGEVIFCGVLLDITARKQAEAALQERKEILRQSAEQLKQQAQREQLLNRLTNLIRSSLDFETTLATAVREICKLLQIDRCSFAWYHYDTLEPYWDVVQESCHPDLPDHRGRYPSSVVGCIPEKLVRLEMLRVDDMDKVTDPIWQELARSLGYKSLLIIPMQSSTVGSIGAICCSHTQSVRIWTDEEVELLVLVMEQLAIALNQAELYTQTQTRAKELEKALDSLQKTQAQLVQSEKMSSLGQLVAGVAHEINNPVSFIYGNITHAIEYTQDLLHLLQCYQQEYPNPTPNLATEIEAIEFDFLVEDLPKLLHSMKMGANRIREIVRSLRTFSRLDEAEVKEVDIHEGIDTTLMILQNRLKAKPNCPEIQIIKEYGKLPLVECYAGQLNQVFMNILVNAIDTLDECCPNFKHQVGTITIRTHLTNPDTISIHIIDNGLGMSEAVKSRLFDPFFTTKPVGKGTGLGLSISYQIVVDKHQGTLKCYSTPGQGTRFEIMIPRQQKQQQKS